MVSHVRYINTGRLSKLKPETWIITHKNIAVWFANCSFGGAPGVGPVLDSTFTWKSWFRKQQIGFTSRPVN